MLRDLFSLFPAHAGVILILLRHAFKGFSFPRTCGGDPMALCRQLRQKAFSPHMRG